MSNFLVWHKTVKLAGSVQQNVSFKYSNSQVAVAYN